MKLKNIFFGLTAAVATMCLSSCDEERDLKIIEGDHFIAAKRPAMFNAAVEDFLNRRGSEKK